MSAAEDRLRVAGARLAAARESGIGVEAAERDLKPLQTMQTLDALVARHRQHDRMQAARREAVADGRDPERAARLAARDPDEPLVFAATARRDKIIDTALRAGRITPAEAPRFRQAMEDADEESVTKLMADMPEGRVPLEAKALVWGPDEIGPPLPPGGALPRGWSLLTEAQQAEIAARRDVM